MLACRFPCKAKYFPNSKIFFSCLNLVHKVLIVYNEKSDERQVTTLMGRKRNFFRGRNGSDALSMAASMMACVLLVIAMIVGGTVSNFLWSMALVCLLYSYFRIFSRNVYRRQMENQWFLRKLQPINDYRARRAQCRRQKNLYCFFKCPQCGTVLRVPKGKGRIRITCRCCSHIFERNS